jgi:hypothetical protein
LTPEFGLQTSKDLKKKFALFGGIPRQVFQPESVSLAVERIMQLVGEVPLETWQAAFSA